jgi:hypothetical protein
MSFWVRLVLAVLATWRVTHLLSSEDGPFDLIARLRAALGQSALGRMMDCFNCLSLWVAAPLAFCVTQKPAELWLAWLALSGAACILERLGAGRAIIAPVVPASEEEMKNELLRPHAGIAPEPSRAKRAAGGDRRG